MAKTKLNDVALRRNLATALKGGMDKAADGLVDEVRLKINVSSREEKAFSDAHSAGKRKRGERIRYIPSDPGEPPRKRTETLRKSIAREVVKDGDSLVARVGSAVDYAYYLEYGTSGQDGSVLMAPRPFLRPAFYEGIERFRRVVAEEVRRRMTKNR